MNIKKKFAIACIYDTETTNMFNGKESRAFPCLFIINDIRDVDLNTYEINKYDNIKFFRYEDDMINYIDKIIEWGKVSNKIPIICAYNLMFDMKPLMEKLSLKYKMNVTAQSTTHVYTLDIIDNECNILLRFWDTYYLEMNGLKTMGITCGLPKALGDWDYSLIRSQKTQLTKQELYYASRDVQVIPMYLRYLLESNDWLKQSDFGISVITKTSLVRQMAKHKIANIRFYKENGKNITQFKMFTKLCEQEKPKTFESYALRKACFRGGLAFTSAKYSCKILKNVASLDVTSMHHAFINGRFIPVKFKKASVSQLENAYDYIVNRLNLYDVLAVYYKPFPVALHMLIRLDKIRLKKDTCFEEYGIGILPSSKFKINPPINIDEEFNNIANDFSEKTNRLNGYLDRAINGVFAFGKLYEADSVYIYVTEIELYAISLVYEWNFHKCISGEITSRFNRPPDYVTLQSNLLFGMKTDVKNILKKYKEVSIYNDVPNTIPNSIKLKIENGTLTEHFLKSYYISTVKGQFNSIYGTMAQDVYKPNFKVENNGDICLDENSKITIDNWLEKQPKLNKVLYTYGMRIVGSSRLHLLIAMKLLYDKLGNKIIISGGDTDSLKISCDDSIQDSDILDSLKPLHIAITKAINITMDRVRKNYPSLASSLKNVGCFEIEDCGNAKRYKLHMECWNKARVSVDVDNKIHYTCAGLSRPEGLYNIESFCNDLLKSNNVYDVLHNVLGFNMFIQPCLSFSLETHIPKSTDIFNENVTDYTGFTTLVNAHESNALYAVGRLLGDLSKNVNRESIEYVKNKYNRDIDIREKILDLDENKNPVIYIDGVIAMKGNRCNNYVKNN